MRSVLDKYLLASLLLGAFGYITAFPGVLTNFRVKAQTLPVENDYDFVIDVASEKFKLDSAEAVHDFSKDVERVSVPQGETPKICDMKENNRPEELSGTLTVDFTPGGKIFGTAQNDTIYDCWYWVGMTYYHMPAGGDPMEGLNLQRFVDETSLTLLAPGESTSFELFLTDDADALCRIQADVHIGPSVDPFNWPDGEPGVNWYSGDHRLVAGKVIGTPYCESTEEPSTANLKGLIWDATNNTCDVPDTQKANLEIGSDDVEGDVETYIVGETNYVGTWNPDSFTGYSYEIDGVPIEADPERVLCGIVPKPTDPPNARYKLKCLDNASTGIQTDFCAITDIEDATETVHLGYELVSTGWFTSLFGDVYGGCSDCFRSVSVDIPEDPDNPVGFENYLIQFVGTVFGNRDVRVENPDGEERYSEDANRYQKNIRTDNMWPSSVTFTPPVGAIDLRNNELGLTCENFLHHSNASSRLDPMKVYKGDAGCIQDGLENLAAGDLASMQYALKRAGVVVIYVTDGDLEFAASLRSISPDHRVLFVVEDSVIVDEGINTIYPLPESRANIEAGIIAQGNIVFSTRLGDSSEYTFDLPIIVEGPLVAKEGSILFTRDGGLRNEMPTEIVRYSPYYLTKLAEQELSSENINRNYTGLFKENLTWEFTR